MNSLDYATRQTRKQYTFKTREQAESFKKAVQRLRLQGKIALRKSLPEFKNHANPGWSVYVTPWALPDEIDVAKLAKEHDGKIWGVIK